MVRETAFAGTGTRGAVVGDSLESKARLLLRLYRRAVGCMDEGIELIEAGRMLEKADRLIRAQDIVLQLHDALDPAPGDPCGRSIASNLSRLYLYVYRCLIRGNNGPDVAAIAEARGHMARLGDAWEQAVREQAAGGMPRRACI